ncbi:MAG: phosphoenolpyruvate synthase PpsA [Desulfobacterales bacterium]|nr:phosphoenolpyruvate synthase PpsA [Desulfobacterales bacterium]
MDFTQQTDDFDLSFKVYYELMAKRVSEILLVSSPYDAFIMEEDGRLAERIIHEYRGLNLSRPPRLTWVSTAQEAFEALSRQKFDLVLTMPRVDDMESYVFGKKIKQQFKNLPVFLLAHNSDTILSNEKYSDKTAIDKIFLWSGNTDLLLALVKSVEDRMNVAYDTNRAKVRVIIMVEDTPFYCSSLLPLMYREIVMQTQEVIEESLNEEHRIFRMRARPKILIAENFEEAENLFRQFRPYLLSVFSDVRFPRDGETDPEAGFSLLSMIKKECPDMPLLMLSSEEANREKASLIASVFLNKNSPHLHTDIRYFLTEHLGFGDFIFRMPGQEKEIARASNLREMEKVLAAVPDESLHYHAMQNDFSSWLMARSEIQMASTLRPVRASDFSSVREMKEFLISCLRARRKVRQRGVVTDFVPGRFDPDTDFMKLGKGSLGGKARGLAFVSNLLKQTSAFQDKFPDISVSVPKTLVISTEGFDSIINETNIKEFISCECSDTKMAEMFLNSQFPKWLEQNIELYLSHIRYPLAVRSSSLLEDAQFQSRAGVYETYMIPNNHPDLSVRLRQLTDAIKLVCASTFYETPRTFARSLLQRTEEEKMAVIIQQVTGKQYGDCFYPAMSGVAQSYNFYPISYLKPEEGIVHLALGLGKTVVEGGASLRFSPYYPQLMPHFSKVDDILRNSQRFFYALNMKDSHADYVLKDNGTLIRLEIDDVRNHYPVRVLSSTYIPEDHRIRDSFIAQGHPVLSFASVLKYNTFPLPEIISEILEIGRKGMGCPVEIEFAVNLPEPGKEDQKPEFALLQIRPMAFREQDMEVEITDEDIKCSFCFSSSALGNGKFGDITDIVFVKTETFDPARTVEKAAEISKINKKLVQQERRYLLIGPGRWGSADRWLGIPVSWNDISGVGAMIETSIEKMKADPSQGSHFFNNITSLGISYLTVSDNRDDYLNWKWLNSLPAENETGYLRHVTLERPLTIKVDGKKSCAVICQ